MRSKGKPPLLLSNMLVLCHPPHSKPFPRSASHAVLICPPLKHNKQSFCGVVFRDRACGGARPGSHHRLLPTRGLQILHFGPTARHRVFDRTCRVSQTGGMTGRWMLLLSLIPCVEKLVGASSQWSSPALHLKFGCHRVEIQQTAAPRTEGPRSHGKWWVSGSQGDGKGDVEPSFDGTGSVVWECGRALCSLVSSIPHCLHPFLSFLPFIPPCLLIPVFDPPLQAPNCFLLHTGSLFTLALKRTLTGTNILTRPRPHAPLVN